MKKLREDKALLEDSEQVISIAPMNIEGNSKANQKALLELQLLMATSSINHEYARVEFEEADCPERKEELLEYMNECRVQYFKAREDLERFNPYALHDFEADLIRQKRVMLNEYNA